MNIILGSLVNVYILIFLDYILIYSAIAEDHTRYIRAIFKWLAKSKFYLKHKEYAMFLAQVKYLGHFFWSVEC